jgi:hypothetical protein
MPEQSPQNDANTIEFREHKDGVCEIYANFVDLGWGRNDVYLRLCHLALDTQAQPDRFVVEVRAAVNMAWPQAKFLRDMLTDAIERYEIANGELKWPELATQNAQEARDQLLMSVPQRSARAN